MPLDPQAQKLLDLARNSGLPPINNVPVAEARTRMAKALTYTYVAAIANELGALGRTVVEVIIF